MIYRRYLISGKVQGVFCRANIKDWAQKHKVNGWVRNLRDSRVELVIHLVSPEQKSLLEDFLRKGPGLAEVTELEELDLEEVEIYTKFSILPDGDYD